jgi:hypothetical protein
MSELEHFDDETPRLSLREAFDAMRHFLVAYWEQGLRSSDDLRRLLSAMDCSMTKDGGPIDIAQWIDWLAAAEKVEAERRAKRH